MPNYCYNKIIITGKSLPEFRKTLEKNEDRSIKFEFNQTVPIFEWKYDNAVKLWGTKWDTMDVDVEVDNIDKMIIKVTTAWSPPMGWADLCELKFSDLYIEIAYIEEILESYGTYSNKELVRNISNKLDGYFDDKDNLYIVKDGKFDKFINKYNFDLDTDYTLVSPKE